MERSLSLGGGQEGLQDSTQFHKGTTGNKIGSNVDWKLEREAQIIKMMI